MVLDTKNKLDDKLIVLSDKPARVTPKQFPIQVKFKQCCSFSDRKLLFELSKLTLHVQLSRQIVVAIKKINSFRYRVQRILIIWSGFCYFLSKSLEVIGFEYICFKDCDKYKRKFDNLFITLSFLGNILWQNFVCSARLLIFHFRMEFWQ